LALASSFDNFTPREETQIPSTGPKFGLAIAAERREKSLKI
jgi:hypothetical protein